MRSVMVLTQPGKLSYGHPGIGTNPHLSAEIFKLTRFGRKRRPGLP